MNYLLEASNQQLHAEMDLQRSIYDSFLMESTFLTTTLEHMVILMEETTETGEKTTVAKSGGVVAKAKSGVSKMAEIFKRIKEFLAKIVNVFIDKVKAMVGGNTEWLKQNKATLASISYDGLQVEMTPFWNVDMKTAISTAQNQVNRVMVLSYAKTQSDRLKDMDEVKKTLFKEFLDEDGELTNGAKNYFRTGKASNAGARPVNISGDQLKEKINGDFISYCETYATSTQPLVTALVKSANDKLDIVIKAASSKENVTESFAIPEFTQIVLEAEEDAKASATTVKVNNTNDNDSVQIKNNASGLDGDALTVLKNIAQCVQIIAAAAMTASEERYTAYMNAMKQIAKTRKGTSSNKNDNEDESDNKEKKNKKI